MISTQSFFIDNFEKSLYVSENSNTSFPKIVIRGQFTEL